MGHSMVSGYIAAGYSQSTGEEHLRRRREKDMESFCPKKECANPTPRGTMGNIRPETYSGKKRPPRQLMH